MRSCSCAETTVGTAPAARADLFSGRRLRERGHLALQAAEIHEHGPVRLGGQGPERGDDLWQRRGHDDDVGREQILEADGAGDVAGPRGIEGPDVVRAPECKRERAADETAAGDADAHQTAAATGRPTAAAIAGIIAISFSKFSNVSDWKPSFSA
jgi:hypothetical protein